MIRKEQYIPEEDGVTNELAAAVRGLRMGESLLISPIEAKTRQKVYETASRARKSIRTRVTATGLRVWLKDQPAVQEVRAALVPDVLKTLPRETEPSIGDAEMWEPAGEVWNEELGEMVEIERHRVTGKERSVGS